MISKLVVKDAARSVVPWWGQVEALRSLSEVTFQPRINVLWGRNGAGKSTVLRALARLTLSEQGGRSVVTESAVTGFFGLGSSTREKFGILLEHDAQAVVSAFAGTKYGLSLGGIDDDFIADGLLSLNQEASSGQAQLGLFERAVFEHMKRERPEPRTSGGRTPLVPRRAAPRKPARRAWPEVEWRVDEARCNDLWRGWVRKLRENLFTAGIPAGRPTVLLDEPDQSLDLDVQARLWGAMPKIVEDEGLQVIVATHSPFAVRVPGAHYIELSPGYLDLVRKSIGGTP